MSTSKKEKELLNGVENQSAKSKVSDKLKGYYVAKAETDFISAANGVKNADGTSYYDAETFEAAKTATKGFTLVYTMPSADTVITDRLAIVSHKWNMERPAGKKWYKTTQEITNGLSILRAYDSYLRYTEDKVNGARRIARAEFNELSTDEMRELLAMWKAQQAAK